MPASGWTTTCRTGRVLSGRQRGTTCAREPCGCASTPTSRPGGPKTDTLRVSNIQTASFSGPVGSSRGTHRHRPDLRVRTAAPTRRLYTPSGGLVEVGLRASPDPTCMLAAWLVAVEETSPDQSGEICIAELYGHAVGPGGSTVRSGTKAHHDPRLTTDMADLALDIDATDWHLCRGLDC